MKYLFLEEVDSTNSYASLHASELEQDTMIIASSQTAGRGQRGNHWESESGKNLTFTLFHRPEGIAPASQFIISVATALAITDMLGDYGIQAKVKWPNDIYIGDRKVCGILIEHSITPTSIEHSRIGAGINVNQRIFRSDAPNPVSMVMVSAGEEDYDLQRVAAVTSGRLESRLRQAETADGKSELMRLFRQRLWRGDGKEYRFRRRGETETFPGVIEEVSDKGPIAIKDVKKGETEHFMFKEVEFIL